MELKQITATDFPQSKALWKEAFADSDGFIETYFASKENTEHAIGFFEGEKPLSQLFILPFYAQTCGSEYEAGFLSGCATAPEARNRDLMRKLVRAAFEDMQRRGISISFLQPFLHAFYRKFGYETVAHVDRYQTREAPGIPAHGVMIESDMSRLPMEAFMRAYETYVTAFDNYFVRPPQRFSAWLGMNFTDGAKAAYIRDETGMLSYALYYEKEDNIAEIYELVYFSDAALRAILGALGPADFFLPENRFPPSFKPVAREEFTMMRVIDPAAVLRQKQFGTTADFTLHVEDDFLGITHDLRVKASGADVAVEQIEKATDFLMDISGFARMITGNDCPVSDQGFAGIFSRGTSCFFETF